MLSFRDLLGISQALLSEATFKLKAHSNNTDGIYLYVKKIQMGPQRYLMQVVDVSDSVSKQNIQQENESLTVLNASVNHELRNPLNSI